MSIIKYLLCQNTLFSYFIHKHIPPHYSLLTYHTVLNKQEYLDPHIHICVYLCVAFICHLHNGIFTFIVSKHFTLMQSVKIRMQSKKYKSCVKLTSEKSHTLNKNICGLRAEEKCIHVIILNTTFISGKRVSMKNTRWISQSMTLRKYCARLPTGRIRNVIALVRRTKGAVRRALKRHICHKIRTIK